MKKLIILLFIISAFISIIPSLNAQYSWSLPQRLTNGFVDKNPSFGYKSIPYTNFNFYNNWELLAFERHSGAYSQICILKLGPTSIVDSVIYLTSNSSLKRNPAISYNTTNFLGSITSALILWETNENSKWDIYGKFFTAQGGWGTVMPLDITTGNKSKPCCAFIDSTHYAVVYEKNGDIFFKKIFTPSFSVQYDTCLTLSDTSYFRNPSLVNVSYVPNPNIFVVTYEKSKPDNKTAIYFRKSVTLPVWSSPDTIAYAGSSTMNSFTMASTMKIAAIFESDRAGYPVIYETEINPGNNQLQQYAVYSNNLYPRRNFISVFYPIITDYITADVNACIRKGNDSTKVLLDDMPGYYKIPDSVTIGDTSKQTVITMNRGLYYTNKPLIWVVYTKDSASYTKLWGKRRLVYLSAVKRLETGVPENFSLSQNYPNPFNPKTKISFSIPAHLSFPNASIGNPFISLKVYDITGREVQTLVNEKLQPGTYEVTFDGSNYASGIYFYQLRAGEFIETKKLVLLK